MEETVLMTVAVDFTTFSIYFSFLVYFNAKIVILVDGDSNSRPFGLIFGIKTKPHPSVYGYSNSSKMNYTKKIIRGR
jgi:hypothetical protein